MGTHKGSSAKKASSPTAMKHKPTSHAKRASPVSRGTTPPQDRSAVQKGWEDWEDQLIIALRKERRTDKQISQRLPGRTEAACRVRDWELQARSQKIGARRIDALNPLAPRKLHLSRQWEDWEDQTIIAHRKVGYSWPSIAKMLPHRTAYTVFARWSRMKPSLEHDTAASQTQSPNAPSIPKPAKTCTPWTPEEDQLTKSLRESGKTWAEVAEHLPNRSAKSSAQRYNEHLRDSRGPPKIPLPWEEWEERLLVSGCYAGLRWKEIARSTGRTINGASNHWNQYFRSLDQDEPWTPEELALLINLRQGGSDWDEISQDFPWHTPNACRTQWYKEKEGIQGPSNHQGNYDSWSAKEVEILVALYNTIGPRWQEICKHIPGRTAIACSLCFHTKCTKEDGVGGPPSEYWTEFFMGKSQSGDLHLPRCFKLISLDEPGSAGIGSDALEATPDTGIRDEPSTPRITRKEQLSVDARKRKVIDIPMV